MCNTCFYSFQRPYNDLGLMGSTSSATSTEPAAKKAAAASHHIHHSPTKGLYDGMDTSHSSSYGLYSSSLSSSKLGLALPNPAPEIEMAAPQVPQMAPPSAMPPISHELQFEDPDEPRKKKYAKEAWPGKKPTPSLLG